MAFSPIQSQEVLHRFLFVSTAFCSNISTHENEDCQAIAICQYTPTS